MTPAPYVGEADLELLSLPLPPPEYRHVPLFCLHEVLGTKPRALHIVGKHSTNSATFPALFLIVAIVQLRGFCNCHPEGETNLEQHGKSVHDSHLFRML